MLLLQNGRVIDPKSGLDQVMDLVTDDGKILELGNDLKEKYFKIKECLSRCGNGVTEITNKEEVVKLFFSFLNAKKNSNKNINL